MFAPTVIRIPTVPAIEQIVRSSFDAPSRWKNRRSIDGPCTSPIVPAYEYGRIACGPSDDAAISPSRAAISSIASSHETLTNDPEPFLPVAPKRIQQTIAMIRSLEVSVDLRAEEPVGERVVRVAGDPRRSAALDGGDASRMYRGSRADRRHARCGYRSQRESLRSRPGAFEDTTGIDAIEKVPCGQRGATASRAAF